jgi:hypothetical protein
MANPEHLQILQQGVVTWNAWRDNHRDILPELSEARLEGADLREAFLAIGSLSKANLEGADLRRADFLKADLYRANLYEANLAGADLSGANLYGACLDKADLSGATLGGAVLFRTSLVGANFSQARLYETIFTDTTLTAVQGLETCVHYGPSILDPRTLARSGPLPLAFLRGCGLNEWEIEATKLYQPGLTPTQINDVVYRIYGLRADPLIQFYSCFISYASQDQTFVERLYEDLQNKGVRCWEASKDMKIGDRIRDTIDQQIRLREKLLVVLSSASMHSSWVEDEVEAALEEERTRPERRTVLVPIEIDNAIEDTTHAWVRTIKRTRHIGDFTHWHDDGEYKKALGQLLQDLKAAET